MIPASYKVRELEIRPATVLAPMAGVTDTLFRRVIRGLGGCGLLMTEFTSSEGITRVESGICAETHRYFPRKPPKVEDRTITGESRRRSAEWTGLFERRPLAAP